MNDINTLRDYLIADEIQRICSLQPDEITAELVSINTRKLEQATDEEILNRSKTHNEY